MTAQIAMPWATLTVAEAARQLKVSTRRVARALARLGMENGVEPSRLSEVADELRRARLKPTGRRSAVRWPATSRPSP